MLFIENASIRQARLLIGYKMLLIQTASMTEFNACGSNDVSSE
jgi:hypothetical protein